MKKQLITIPLVLLGTISLKAQIQAPVKWSYATKKVSPTEVVLLFKATIDDEWHIYSIYQGEGGPLKTSFALVPSKDYTKMGKVIEPKPYTSFDKTFGVNVNSFEKEVIFQQKIILRQAQGNKPISVKGSLEFMVCNDHQCLPPDKVEFSIPVK